MIVEPLADECLQQAHLKWGVLVKLTCETHLAKTVHLVAAKGRAIFELALEYTSLTIEYTSAAVPAMRAKLQTLPPMSSSSLPTVIRDGKPWGFMIISGHIPCEG
jgi:hypothetical protein